MLNHLVAHTDAHDLRARLEWGQPGLTIVDVRDRFTYNHGHITGAMPMPLEDLPKRAKASLHQKRDIYVYGENDEQSAHAAQLLRDAGFIHVSEIIGGLSAWQIAGGPVEGV
ncbi:rhodanese [Calothrix sp. HK-06]|nr:rhodanese [Calothrix sp. HK-06]